MKTAFMNKRHLSLLVGKTVFELTGLGPIWQILGISLRLVILDIHVSVSGRKFNFHLSIRPRLRPRCTSLVQTVPMRYFWCGSLCRQGFYAVTVQVILYESCY